ncbi:hypothetical protein Fmac_012155 [Flemingia macrophylla]|uniref:Uncharacterized protein n=1 Tax=Flemingia macrophylla TaxID=520843 RepID=A0ABD1MPH0_9FABA
MIPTLNFTICRTSFNVQTPPLCHPRSSNLSFNQDHDYLASTIYNVFRVYLCDLFRELFHCEFDGGEVGHTEMLFRSNILALVGSGSHPQYPPIKVMIWDHYSSRSSSQLSNSLILACPGLH